MGVILACLYAIAAFSCANVRAEQVLDLQGFNDTTMNRRNLTPDDFLGEYRRFMELSNTGHQCAETLNFTSNGKVVDGAVQIPFKTISLDQQQCLTPEHEVKFVFEMKMTSSKANEIFFIPPTSTGILRLLRKILLETREYYIGSFDGGSCGSVSILSDTAILLTSDCDTFGSELRVQHRGCPKILVFRDRQKSCVYSGKWINHTTTPSSVTPAPGQMTTSPSHTVTPTPEKRMAEMQNAAEPDVSSSMFPDASEAADPDLPSSMFPDASQEAHVTPESQSVSLSPTQSTITPTRPPTDQTMDSPSTSPSVEPKMMKPSETASPQGSLGPNVLVPEQTKSPGSPSVPRSVPLPPQGHSPQATMSLTPNNSPSPTVKIGPVEEISPSPSISSPSSVDEIGSIGFPGEQDPRASSEAQNPLDAMNTVEPMTSTSPSHSMGSDMSGLLEGNGPLANSGAMPSPSFEEETTAPEGTRTPVTLPESSPMDDVLAISPSPVEPMPVSSRSPIPVSSRSPIPVSSPSRMPVSSSSTEAESEISPSAGLPTVTESPISQSTNMEPSAVVSIVATPKESGEVAMSLSASPSPDISFQVVSFNPESSAGPFPTIGSTDVLRESSQPEFETTVPSPIVVSSSDASPSPSVTTTVGATAPGTPVPDSGSACFPARGLVRLGDGRDIEIQFLQIGDLVHVGKRRTSLVIAFTHLDPYIVTTFVKIFTDVGKQIILSGTHYIYTAQGLKRADEVLASDYLQLEDGNMTKVLKTATVYSKGLYNPHTMDGDIVVDGFRTSTYTAAVQPITAHALLTPVRMFSVVQVLQSVVLYLSQNPIVVGAATSIF